MSFYSERKTKKKSRFAEIKNFINSKKENEIVINLPPLNIQGIVNSPRINSNKELIEKKDENNKRELKKIYKNSLKHFQKHERYDFHFPKIMIKGEKIMPQKNILIDQNSRLRQELFKNYKFYCNKINLELPPRKKTIKPKISKEFKKKLIFDLKEFEIDLLKRKKYDFIK